RRRVVWIVVGVACGLVLAGLALAPWLLGKTFLRDRLLNALVANDEVKISSRGASFGYMSPLSLSGLAIEDRAGNASITVATVAAERSWLQMLLSRPDLGRFTVEEPRFDVTLRGGTPVVPTGLDAGEPTRRGSLPTLVAEIRNAGVRVQTLDAPTPVIDLEDINVTFQLLREGETSLLVVEPVTIFDHQPLTPELCGTGLQLVAPLVADAVTAHGAFTFRLDEFRLPLGMVDAQQRAEAVQVRGVLELHAAKLGLRSSIIQRLIELAVRLLGDELPAEITVAQDLRVAFHVADGRVHHEGLALVLPHRDSAIRLQSSGSVGMDESLDLEVEIQLPSGLLGDSRLGSQLASRPLRLKVAGTLAAPQLRLAEDQSWVRQLAERVLGDASGTSDGELARRVTDAVGTLLQRAAERAAERPPRAEQDEVPGPRLRDRFRQRREARGTREPD
ncbi:MAG: hypothetical protein MUF48_24755, partial [Pirellulaceae bacterium]|nr:hypothetical protein [Pirellulaceae bacterium]